MILFDIETDGLLDALTRVHCLCAVRSETGETFRYHGGDVEARGLPLLSSGEPIGGHNIIKFDLPALRKVYGFARGEEREDAIYDTLVASRLAFGDIGVDDMALYREGKLTGKEIGSHSLKAWGIRLGVLKGAYAEEGGDKGWSAWSPALEDYCAQDVAVTLALYQRLQRERLSRRAVDLEHRFCALIFQQEQRGVGFDRAGAERLHVELLAKRNAAGDKLRDIFGSWQVELPPLIPKKDNKARGYEKGKAVRRFKTVVFNPSSRSHIADRLSARHGWQPTQFTPSGKPMVDEKIVAKLPYPEVPALLEYLLLDKRLGQLAEGEQAWLKLERGGRLYGSVNTCGTVTGRCSHACPNLAQVPSVSSPYGRACRALFIPAPGYVMVGCDAASLELRCLAHYMAAYDGGAYAKVICEGDIHSVNQAAAGLPTRDAAKVFIYAFLYGAGDGKLGSVIHGTKEDGARLKAQFICNLPALGKLAEEVRKAVKSKGHLRGLDGRRLRVRSLHSALNTLLQAAGAVIMKMALIIADRDLQAAGLAPGADYAFVLNIHDEMQAEVRPEHADRAGGIMAQAIAKVQDAFKLQCPLGGAYKIGANWAETH